MLYEKVVAGISLLHCAFEPDIVMHLLQTKLLFLYVDPLVAKYLLSILMKLWLDMRLIVEI